MQPFAVGITVTVVDIAEFVFVVFVAVKAEIFPVPLAAKPTAVFELVQLKVVPATFPVNAIAFVVAPAQTTSFCGCVTVGVGLTVIVNVTAVPKQPFAEGVTMIVAT